MNDTDIECYIELVKYVLSQYKGELPVTDVNKVILQMSKQNTQNTVDYRNISDVTLRNAYAFYKNQ